MVFVLFRGGSSEQETKAASVTSVVTTTSETSTTTLSVTLSNTHTTTVSSGPRPAAPDLVNWLQGGGLQQTGALLEQSSLVLSHTSLSNSCESLARSVRLAKAYKPIPDDATQRMWIGVLAGFDHGAAGCANGTSAKEIGASNQALQQVMTRLSDLAR